ncbi:hypothetical protein ACWHA1_26225 [Streptomyces decoyicus]
MDALPVAGCRKISADKKSGKTVLRPELKACHAFLDAGDTLVVPGLATPGALRPCRRELGGWPRRARRG